MSEFDRHAERHLGRQEEGMEQKLGRECSMLFEGFGQGLGKSVEAAANDPLGTAGKFTASAVSGLLMSRILTGARLGTLVTGGISSALGVLGVSELIHSGRLNSLHEAINQCWQSDANLSGNTQKVADTLGPLAFDALVMSAGGGAGSALAGKTWRTPVALDEWPQFVMTKDGFSHTFADRLIYKTSPRGAELSLPNGESFRWTDSRPFFSARGRSVEFAGGSSLKFEPHNYVHFKGRTREARLDLRSDLKNDFHIAEHDRILSDKSGGRRWERLYQLKDGSMLVQYPGSVYQITTPGGSGLLFKDNAIQRNGVFKENDFGITTKNFRPPRPGQVDHHEHGTRMRFDDGTEINIGRNGKMQIKGVLTQDFEL